VVGGSESEDSDESASSDDERAARLGCTKRTRSARARRFLCLALGQQAGSGQRCGSDIGNDCKAV